MKAKGMTEKFRPKAGRNVAMGLALAGAGAWATVGGAALQSDTADEVRTLQQTYIELKAQTSKERQSQTEAKVFLNDEISLLESRIASLNENTEKLESERGDTAEKRAELEADKAALDASTASLEAAIVGLEQQMLEIMPMLPAPLKEQVNSVARNIPKDEADAEAKGADLHTRYLQVVGAINYIDRFNGDVTVMPELVPIPATGETRDVTVIYFGAGQAYYVDDTGQYAGIGRPTPEGFVWTADDSIAPQVALMKKIRTGGAAAEFVPVPVNVQ